MILKPTMRLMLQPMLASMLRGGAFAGGGVIDPPPWQPSDLTSLMEWWKADDISPVGLAPASWPSAAGDTGLTLTQPAEASRPEFLTRAINGITVPNFDGTDDYMFTGGGLDARMPEFLFRAGNSTAFKGTLETTSGTFTTLQSNNLNGTPTGLKLYEIRFDAAADTVTIWQNGAQDSGASAYSGATTAHLIFLVDYDTPNPSSDGIIGNYATGGITIGKHRSPFYQSGGFAELIITDSILAGEDYTNVIEYLTGKWYADGPFSGQFSSEFA